MLPLRKVVSSCVDCFQYGAQASVFALHGRVQFSIHLPSRFSEGVSSAYQLANAAAGVISSTSVQFHEALPVWP